MSKENWNKLTEEEERIIVGKGTEPPFTGKFLNCKKDGTFICRRCGKPLFTSDTKFDSKCGWPAFDKSIPGSVKEQQDERRSDVTEILCNACDGHLGHVFRGEKFTPENTRYCVNSISLDFVSKDKEQ